ncbi:hypothetical protein BX666DRAFT_19515 [Dichotomocladium elegans]|nr:hypothetical protein BX666DRAFT_19515 [Dichotomocladium elegans]
MSSDPLNERPWTSPSPFINKSNNNIGSSSYDSRYGNAYENEDIHAAWGADAPPITSMPSPSKYRTPHNVWNESNKTEFEESDASTLLSTHSRTSFAERETSQVKAKKNKRPDEVEKALPEKWDESRLHPSKRRFLLRILQLVAAVGSIGFAAGASPVCECGWGAGGE